MSEQYLFALVAFSSRLFFSAAVPRGRIQRETTSARPADLADLSFTPLLWSLQHVANNSFFHGDLHAIGAM